jgi:hypothetical protein
MSILQSYVSCVSDVFCICFIWMLEKVDLVLHILQWLYTYVASVCSKCFICFKRMLEVFYLDIAYVAMAIYVCCKCMFQMFHLFQTYVATLQVFYLNVVYVPMLHMFQTYVASVYSKCVIYFRHILQMCLSGCCSCYTQMLQTYVYKCFTCVQTYVTEVLSCCNTSRRRKQAHADAVPTCVAVPHLHAHQQA